MEEMVNEHEPSLEDHPIIKEFKNVFSKIPWFPPIWYLDLHWFQNTTHNEHTRIERVIEVARRDLEERIHMPKKITTGFPNIIC